MLGAAIAHTKKKEGCSFVNKIHIVNIKVITIMCPIQKVLGLKSSEIRNINLIDRFISWAAIISNPLKPIIRKVDSNIVLVITICKIWLS